MYFKYFFIFYKFFMKKNIKKAFTLIEIMLVLVIIWLILVAFSSISLYNLSDKQKWEILTNQIISQIETTRNNALIWKVMNNNIVKSWKVELSSSWNLVKTFYENTSGAWVEDSRLKLNDVDEEISEIDCWTPVTTWIIIFKGMESSLSWACAGHYNMDITIKKSAYSSKINYDSINNLVE